VIFFDFIITRPTTASQAARAWIAIGTLADWFQIASFVDRLLEEGASALLLPQFT
jgi:hypothetical protein